ncbi:hypothetical protein BH09BAC3_BH09BAC3_08060 [soil metagenome]
MKITKRLGKILVSAFIFFPSFLYAQYSGGINDGASSANFCSNSLNGGAAAAPVLNSIVGASTFCNFGSDTYSISLSSGTATVFSWILPVGATIVTSVNTPTSSTISVLFGNTAGSISVSVTNPCFTVSSGALAVSNTACDQYLGSTNDGFNTASFCGTNLNGGTALAPVLTSIVGSTTFCNLGSDIYSITLSSGTANGFLWSLPTGATILNTINTPTSSTISVLFGSTPGSISVTISNSCFVVTSSVLSVSNVTCDQFFGGSNDGFSTLSFCGSDLNGASLGTISLSAISGATSFCFDGSQNYSVSILSGIATTFSWSAPAGGNVLASVANTTSSIAGIGFGPSNGTVQVTASNGCSTATATVAVTGQNCNLALGGNNDGFSTALFCGINLAGGSLGPITLSAITSSANYCIDSGQSYSATTLSGLATSYVWTATIGTGVVSGTLSTTSSSLASISFPGASGTVQLDASNGCFSDTKTLAITGVNCDITLGGNDDGFTTGYFCATTLNGGALPTVSLSAISGGNYCFNLGQTFSATATGSPNSYTWSIAGTGIVNSVLNSYSSSAASMNITSAGATINLVATNGCTSDSKSIAVTGLNCDLSLGGNDDGFTLVTFCGSNLSGGVLSPIALNPITGGANFCFNLGSNYAVTVASGAASLYTWSGPPGAGAFAQVNTGTSSLASIGFVGTNGNVSVTATNGCSTATATLLVTGQNCGTTVGNFNDGYSSLSFCGSDLTGGTISPLTLGPIAGSSSVCFNLGQNFSVATTAGSATSFLWTLPGGSLASNLNTFTSSLANVLIGPAAGTLQVTASNACYNATSTLILSGQNCNQTFGGNNDGFAMALLNNVPLPIELGDFTARIVNRTVVLSWYTLSEKNNDFFTIEKSSDGKVFSALRTVKGAGTSLTRNNYEITDGEPYRGTSYYRLNQTDFDGKKTTHSIVVVHYDIAFSSVVQLYPNPTVGDFEYTSEEEITMVEVVDLTGHVVYRKALSIINREGKVEVAILASGTYIVRFFTISNKVEQLKLVKFQ